MIEIVLKPIIASLDPKRNNRVLEKYACHQKFEEPN